MSTDARAQAYYQNVINDRRKSWPLWNETCNQYITVLSESIAAGAVVAYVGAGPSIASGKGSNQIPGWKDLCQSLLEWTGKDPNRPIQDADYEYLHQLFDKGNFPLFCQILDNAYRNESDRLRTRLKEIFSVEGLKPSDAYRAIAMLPIALRLTTNYEDLLECAIRDLGPAYKKFAPPPDSSPLTWRHGARILDLVRSGKPGVVNVHGNIRSDDIVLTKSHYRQLYSDAAFRDVLKALLSTRTFLFIGCSMSDPDIFALMDEIIEECQLVRKSGVRVEDTLPLHFALLSHNEWKPAFVDHLRYDYRIASLPVPNGSDEKPDLAPLLRLLSGKVAQTTKPILHKFSPIFAKQTADERLSEIIQCTGSDRADIALEGHGRDLEHWFTWDWHLPKRELDVTKESRWRDNPPQDGVISAAYFEPVAFQYAPRLPNARNVDVSVETQSTGSNLQGTYLKWDDYCRSELAVPIMARGLRIGVLNIESYFIDAYTHGHRIFLQEQAELIGALRLEAEERDRGVRKIEAIAGLGPSGVAFLIENLRKLYPGARSLEGIFYTPNFAWGKLHGYFKDCEKPIQHYPYQDHPSFASSVFRQRDGLDYLDVKDAMAKNLIDAKLANAVGLREGPVYGCQVFDRELMCGVLVLWARQGESAETFEKCGLRDPSRQMVLATGANLLVAAHKWKTNLEEKKKNKRRTQKEKKQGLDQNLDQVLQCVNAFHSASSEDQIFEHAAHAALALGLKRLRVWRINHDDQIATIGYAWPESYFDKVKDAIVTWVEGLKQTADGRSAIFSEHCRSVCKRHETYPWARLQGPSVSGPVQNADSERLLSEILQMPLGTNWIIVPVVIGIGHRDPNRPKRLWGFLSADTVSASDASSDRDESAYKDEDERNFMECGMSVVAVGLSSALAPFTIGSRSLAASGS